RNSRPLRLAGRGAALLQQPARAGGCPADRGGMAGDALTAFLLAAYLYRIDSGINAARNPSWHIIRNTGKNSQPYRVCFDVRIQDCRATSQGNGQGMDR